MALPGGRHPGAGTANLIVPLGSSYLELIAVVDAAEAEQHRRWLVEAVAAGRRLAAWAVRTSDLDATRRALQTAGWELPAPEAGARRRPDGTVLLWRTQQLEPPGSGSLPFLIEWASGQEHPGSAPVRHPSGAHGIRSVVVGDGHGLGLVLGGDIPYEVRAGTGQPGLIEVVLPAEGRDLVIS